MFLEAAIGGREAAVESDGEFLASFGYGLLKLTALFDGESHRLFEKDILACAQSGQRLRRMLRVSADDDNSVDFGIFQDLVVIGAAVLGAETQGVAFATRSAGGVDGAQAKVCGWNDFSTSSASAAG